MKMTAAKKKYLAPQVQTVLSENGAPVLLACTNQANCYGDGSCCAPDFDACIIDCP